MQNLSIWRRWDYLYNNNDTFLHWKRISPRNNFQGENILFRSRMVLSFILAGIRTASECFRWPLRPSFKHSLAVEIPAKLKESTILDRKRMFTLEVVSCSDKSVSSGGLEPPLGLYYSPRFARDVKADPRGVKTALGNTFPWAGINFLGEIHFRLRKVPFLWTSLSLEKRVLVRLMDLDRFKTMEEQSDSYQYHKGRFMKTILIPCEALLIYHWMSMAIFTENKQTPKNCSLTNMVT